MYKPGYRDELLSDERITSRLTKREIERMKIPKTHSMKEYFKKENAALRGDTPLEEVD